MGEAVGSHQDHYPQSGEERAPCPLENMLRMHCVQLFYNLSDPAMEDMLYEVKSLRHFTGIGGNKVPEESTIPNFRHLLERHGLGKVLLRPSRRTWHRKD